MKLVSMLLHGLLAVVPAVSLAASGDYPSRPVRLISPFSPGGGNDVVSRTLALALSKDFGNVVVDNRPGANTIIGMELVAKAAADGYTLIMTSSTTAINATLYPKAPYDVIRDFAAVALVGSSPLIVAVPVASPISSIPALIAAAKVKPGELSYPSAGTGNATHLGAELFSAMTRVNLLHVPYKGSAPGITDLIAGRHAVVFSTSASVMPHLQSGRLRALATTGSKRFSALPQLPTVSESGVPGYEAATWYGVMAPARTPRSVITRLNNAIATALAIPEVRERLVAQGVEPSANTADEFAAYLKTEIAKWAKIVRAAGMKPE
jgi:tripartite-type tricarboxylate transporter receptor subunit TctC